MVKLLTCRGVDVNSTTSNGDTILHFSIANFNELAYLDLIKRFIEAGGDLSI